MVNISFLCRIGKKEAKTAIKIIRKAQSQEHLPSVKLTFLSPRNKNTAKQ